MLLQRLHEYRQRDDVDAKIPPAYHKRRDIQWILKLDADGCFVAWLTADRKEAVPYLRRSGRKPPPYLLVDNYPYWLGDTLDNADLDANKAQMRWELMVELVEELIEGTPEAERAIFESVLSFLTSDERKAALDQAPGDMSRNDLIAAEVGGKLVFQEKAARRFWTWKLDDAAISDSQTTTECILCAERKPIPRTQPVELTLGPDRVQIISANANAFESFGLKQSAISPVCQPCARSYGEAARNLMNSDSHRYRLGDVTYIFWTREPTEFDVASIISSPEEEHVRTLLKSVHGGSKSGVDETAFYACAMTANTSRLVIRDYLETTVFAVKQNLMRWLKAQSLVDVSTGEPGRPYGLYALATSLVREAKDLPPSTIPMLLGAALYGRPIAPRILAQAIGRVRADGDNRVTRPRVVLIKMALNDLKRFSDNSDTQELQMTEGLNRDEDRPAYLCGRLIALLEEAQYAALGNINSTIVDRYFGTASAAPASVFGRLLRGSQAHFQKLRKKNPGARENIERGVEEILSRLPSSFPNTLTLEEQGVFAIGYYHQRADSRRRMNAAIDAKKAAKTAARILGDAGLPAE
jgi:CRISPR-associated protein Csd1